MMPEKAVNNSSQTGRLYLIPCPIALDATETIPEVVLKLVPTLQYFVVERLRTARRFIKSVDKEYDIDAASFYEIPKDGSSKVSDFLVALLQGHDVGLISEAGNPAIADPGNDVVSWCHLNKIKVVPLPGPSSILMALISSGFNGQNFAFNGYLPNDKTELIRKLKVLESSLLKSGQTQLFMETPYRNGFMIDACLEALQPQTLLMVACDLCDATEEILVLSIKDWKKVESQKFHKRPAIFGIGIWPGLVHK